MHKYIHEEKRQYVYTQNTEFLDPESLSSILLLKLGITVSTSSNKVCPLFFTVYLGWGWGEYNEKFREIRFQTLSLERIRVTIRI